MNIKKLAAIILLCALGAALCSCEAITGDTEPKATIEPMTAEPFAALDSVFSLYNEVTFEDTLETLTARYGEPSVEKNDNGTHYTWKNESGFGFTAIFFESGKLRAKIVQYDDIRQFAGPSGASHIDNAAYLDDDMEYDTVKIAFGAEGIEIMRLVTDSTDKGQEQYLMLWVDSTGGAAQVLFSVSDNKMDQVSYSLGE